MFDIDELEREQLENIVELIQGPKCVRSISKYSQYKNTLDPEGDRNLESLLFWVDCIIAALEDVICLKDKPDVYWSRRSEFPELKNAREREFDSPELFILSEILVDLRRCAPNKYINRSLRNSIKGRRSDHPKYKLLKDEIGKVYNLLRFFFVSSNDACNAINDILFSNNIPIMSNDNIRKRASKIKGFPCYQELYQDEDSEDENCFGLTTQDLISLRSTKEIQQLVCHITLNEFIKDALPFL